MPIRPVELSTLENPYEAPSAARILPEKQYAWPLPTDRVLEVNASIDQPTLNECMRCEPDIVRNYRIVWGILLLPVLVFLAITLSYGVAWMAGDIEWATLCILAVVAWIVISPWIFYRTHLRDRWTAFRWAWGTVNIRINCDGVQWYANDNVFQQQWDGFSQLLLTDHCIWLASSIPWPIRLPIHRNWVSLEMWNELLTVCRSHSCVVDVNDFFKYRKTHSQFYSLGQLKRSLAAPESPVELTGQFSFRSPDDAHYGSDRTTNWLHGIFFWPIVIVSLTPMALKITGYFAAVDVLGWEDRINKQIGMWPMFLGLIVNLPRLILPRLAFGAKFMQRSQAGMNSQSGFVSRDQVLFASPFHSLLINMPFIQKVKLDRDCMVLTIDKKSGQAIVIPRDQFLKADEAWKMYGDGPNASDQMRL